MKKTIVISIILVIFPLVSVMPQGVPLGDGLGDRLHRDNTMGDYLLSSRSMQKRVSMDLENALLVDVLKVLSQQTGLNFISTEAVRSRNITLYFEEVPLKEAIDTVFKANNLSYDYYPDSNVFIVKEMGKPTMELLTRVYPLRHTRMQDSRLQSHISGCSDDGDEDGGDSGIEAALEKVLTEFGKIASDPITNSLIITDVPSQFPLIEQVINSLDIPQAKIMIEVELLDVSKDTADSLGVSWPDAIASLDVIGSRMTSFPFMKGRGTRSIDQGMDPGGLTTLLSDSSNVGNAVAGAGTANTITWAGSHFAPSVLTVIGAKLALQFLKSQTDTRFLARPKILTLANETAEVKIAADAAIGVITTVTEGGQTETVERGETGVTLEVTPQVNMATREITLFIDAKVSAITGTPYTTSSGFPIRDIEERGAKTVGRLRDGETFLIGGLIRKETTVTDRGIPVLGDIPILGRLFRSTTESVEDRELLIFLTPRIIEDTPVQRAAPILDREQNATRQDSIQYALDRYSKF